MHGALKVGVPLGEYFASPTLVAEGQLKLRAKYHDDVVYPFFYGALEHEAFGGEVEFFEDGPPIAMASLFSQPSEIESFVPPKVEDSVILQRPLEAMSILSDKIQGEALIVGVVISPFSLPILQLGFVEYLNLMNDQPELLAQLYRKNEHFVIEWGNAQLAAGANAIGYFDPMSSPTILPHEKFLEFGFPLMKKFMSSLNGPSATLLASGYSEPIFNQIAQTGSVIAGVAAKENLADVKKTANKRFTIMGNLNAIEMRTWSEKQAYEHVYNAIQAGAPGGGFILSDTHGEIPIQVPEQTLLAIVAATEEFGRYPIEK